jgi:hypothetical protein
MAGLKLPDMSQAFIMQLMDPDKQILFRGSRGIQLGIIDR